MYLHIIDGPARGQLLDNFTRLKKPIVPVFFITEDEEMHLGNITSLTMADDKRTSFFFAGEFNGKLVTGFYDANPRLGWFENSPKNPAEDADSDSLKPPYADPLE